MSMLTVRKKWSLIWLLFAGVFLFRLKILVPSRIRF